MNSPLSQIEQFSDVLLFFPVFRKIVGEGQSRHIPLRVHDHSFSGQIVKMGDDKK
jgi:hypothetical protein